MNTWAIRPSRMSMRWSMTRRDSRKADYMKLLDWTGRQGRSDKRGKIPAALAPILERLGIDPSMWFDLVWGYKKYFGRSRAAGRPEDMHRDAAQHGHRWVSGQRSATECFCT